jgi:chromosome segregation ATPase
MAFQFVFAMTVGSMMQLKTIKDRLEKLSEEREQLMEYQRLDKKRKAIEFCILDHDRVKIVKELNGVCEIYLLYENTGKPSSLA